MISLNKQDRWGGERRRELIKRNSILFCLILVLREVNRARFELFNAVQAVSFCQAFNDMQRNK